MSEKRGKKKTPDMDGKTLTFKVYFRRCHLCSGVSEKEEIPVDRCDHCGKPMAPFYFFNDLEVAPVSDSEVVDETMAASSGEFRRPIRGFTAHW